MKNKLGLVMIVAILATALACESKKAENADSAAKTDSTAVKTDSTAKTTQDTVKAK
jgi:hypothetical protein